MTYLFLGVGLVWAVLGVMRILEGWGQTEEMKVALSFLLMAVFNVGIAWFLYWRRERRSTWRP